MLYIGELEAMSASPSIGAGGGKSRDPANLETKLERLNKRRKELEEEAGVGGSAIGVTFVDMR